jgi:hypothetical protein
MLLVVPCRILVDFARRCQRESADCDVRVFFSVAVFAGAILFIPIASLLQHFDWVLTLSAIVMVEVTIVALNDLRCPLTALAARYTEDQRTNFDIHLPLWLATYNKQVFGALFVFGLIFSVICWLLR